MAPCEPTALSACEADAITATLSCNWDRDRDNAVKLDGTAEMLTSHTLGLREGVNDKLIPSAMQQKGP